MLLHTRTSSCSRLTTNRKVQIPEAHNVINAFQLSQTQGLPGLFKPPKDFQGSKGSSWLKGFKSLPDLPRASERLEPLDGELKASTPAPAVQVLAKDVEVAWQGSLNIVVGCQDSRPWIDTYAWEFRAAARNPFCPQKLSAPKTCDRVVEYCWMKSSTSKCKHAVDTRHWALFCALYYGITKTDPGLPVSLIF